MARKPPQRSPSAASPSVGPTLRRPVTAPELEAQVERTVQVAAALYYGQQFRKARTILSQALTARPDHYAALCLLGQVLGRGFEDADGAFAAFERARAARPNDSYARVLRAELLSQNGQTEAAAEEARAILEKHPRATLAYRLLADIAADSIDDATLARMVDLDRSDELPDEAGRRLAASIGRVYERRGEYDRAFDFFARANGLAPQTYDAAAVDRLAAELRAGLDPAFFQDRRSWGGRDARHVFLIGMPRCGSTLLERVAVAHPRIDSCGESNAAAQLERMIAEKKAFDDPTLGMTFLSALSKNDVRSAGHHYASLVAPHLTKKQPLRILNKANGNFERFPFLRVAFPSARFIHLFRHPLDMLFSCYRQDFLSVNFSVSFEALAHFYRFHLSMMDLWQELAPEAITHICYEDFVSDFDARARRLIGGLDAPWDDACLEPHKAAGVVTTASQAQVRQPVNANSFGQWKRYASQLAPLIEMLGGLDRLESDYQRYRALQA